MFGWAADVCVCFLLCKITDLEAVMHPKKQCTGRRQWRHACKQKKDKAGNVFSTFVRPWGYMCFRETLQVNINGVCSKENCVHCLEVSNKENVTHLSHPALISVSPAAFSLSCFFHVMIKKMHFPSLLMQRAHHRISWKIRRPGSTCCRRLKLLSERMKKPLSAHL